MLQKKYEDFAEKLYAEFPDIEEKTIDDIANYGLKKIYQYVKTGEDILLRERKFYTFIGNWKKESLNQWIDSKVKEHHKKRKMFSDAKEIWDGWHYIGMTEDENTEFCKIGYLPTINLYKLIKECAIRKNIKYIYKTKLGYTCPQNKILWMEKRENYSKELCELSKEGTLWLEKRKIIKEKRNYYL